MSLLSCHLRYHSVSDSFLLSSVKLMCVYALAHEGLSRGRISIILRDSLFILCGRRRQFHEAISLFCSLTQSFVSCFMKIKINSHSQSSWWPDTLKHYKAIQTVDWYWGHGRHKVTVIVLPTRALQGFNNFCFQQKWKKSNELSCRILWDAKSIYHDK